jgi:hypothetical protein
LSFIRRQVRTKLLFSNFVCKHSITEEGVFLLKRQLKAEKDTAELIIDGITIIFKLIDAKSEILFDAQLNYDELLFKQFTRMWPPGNNTCLVFGASRSCQFYVINPEPITADY